MKKLLFLVGFLLCFHFSCFSQQVNGQTKNTKTILFWNVDNLYDIVNDPNTGDDQFIPTSPKQWNSEKYKKKVTDLAKILSSIDDGSLPVIIGLAEVENHKVLEDLTSSPQLINGKYGIVHYEGKDPDGLEVALLYKKDDVEILSLKSIPVVPAFEIKTTIKDILYVKCKLKEDYIYHLFVTHWPSRTMDDQDELKRISAAIGLRKEIDNIFNVENQARIIIMGDFNDEPTNKSMIQFLNATNKRKNINYRDLFNMMYDMHNLNNEGTYSENRKLFMFDQIIVSAEMFNEASGYFISYNDGRIFKGGEPKINDSVPGIRYPEPTYSGNKYLGGVSSHFPVYIILKKTER